MARRTRAEGRVVDLCRDQNHGNSTAPGELGPIPSLRSCGAEEISIKRNRVAEGKVNWYPGTRDWPWPGACHSGLDTCRTFVVVTCLLPHCCGRCEPVWPSGKALGW